MKTASDLKQSGDDNACDPLHPKISEVAIGEIGERVGTPPTKTNRILGNHEGVLLGGSSQLVSS